MEQPLVSIIMPTYNGCNLVEKSLISILNQTYTHLEVFIIDDNGLGTEQQIETEKVIIKYLSNKRVNYICHEVNKNGSAARNTGIKICHGKYICFLDDDDVFDPQKIEKQVLMFENDFDEEIGMIYTGVKEIGKATIISHPIPTDNFMRDYLMTKIVACSSSIMIRKKVIDVIGLWDESFKRHQDMEFVVRISSKFKVSFIDEPLVIKYREDRNFPFQSNKLNEYRRYYLKKMTPFICTFNKRTQRKIMFYNLLQIGKGYLKDKKFCLAFKIMIESKRPLKMFFYYVKDFIKYKKRYSGEKNREI